MDKQIEKLIEKYTPSSESQNPKLMLEFIKDLKALVQHSNSGVQTDYMEFDQYCGEARDKYVLFIRSLPWDTQTRTQAEDLLICFDQMRSRLFQGRQVVLPQPDHVPDTGNGVEYILRKFNSDKHYWCKCENCGWEDSSEFAEGGHAIADTGDYSDPVCPICFSNKLEGDSVLGVPEGHKGVCDVRIALPLVLNPYKKTIQALNDVIDNLRFPNVPDTGNMIEDLHKQFEDETGYCYMEATCTNYSVWLEKKLLTCQKNNLK